MSTRKMTQCLLLVLISMPWFECFGQQNESGPSKDETIEFLKKKMEGSNVETQYVAGIRERGGIDHTFKAAIVVVEGSCQLMIRETEWDRVYMKGKGGEQTTEKTSSIDNYLDLSKVSLGQIKSEETDPHASQRQELRSFAEAQGQSIATLKEGDRIFRLVIPAVQRGAFRFVKTINGDRQPDTTGTVAVFPEFSDAETAGRIAKAIAHLAKLCGASNEPF